MIDARLLFNRDTVLESAPDGVAEAGRVYPVPAAHVRRLIGSGCASLAPDEPELPPTTSLDTKALGGNPAQAPKGRK